MISKKIIDSDSFLEMSAAAQVLYFHLNMGADDDGFNNQVQMAMYKAHASVDDLKLLVMKNFLIRFESGVYVIKDWRVHNTLRKDRYVPTSFQNEFKLLGLNDDNAYAFARQMSLDLEFKDGQEDDMLDAAIYGLQGVFENTQKEPRQPSGNQMTTVGCRRLDKNRLDKNRLDNYNYYNNSPNPIEKKAENSILEVDMIFAMWNQMQSTIHHKELNEVRKTAIKKALSKYEVQDIIQAIENYDLVLRSYWYFNYKWSLEDFLNRKNGISTFTNEGSNWNTFQEEVNKNPMLLPKEEWPQAQVEKKEAPQAFKDFLKQIK
ncbi:MAG: hypothetical protein NC087_04535 [Anaeroplasma bactoclasticum]|nr:hypothetical protein [Anaeroplasma bactoclasticum]